LGIPFGPEGYDELMDIYARWIIARLTLLTLRDEARKDGPLTSVRRRYREKWIGIAEIELAAAEAELVRLQLGGRR
jgi:hypothetical protein